MLKRTRHKVGLIGALLLINGALALHAAAIPVLVYFPKCRYQAHPASGTWGEYCLTSCPFCECGGDCEYP